MSNVLFLSVSIGSGHDQAASAIAQAMIQLDPMVSVEIRDYIQTNSRVGKPVKAAYLTALRTAPAVYSFLYRESQRRLYRRFAFWLMDKSARASSRRLLRSDHPNLIVCTHPLPVPGLTTWRERSGIDYRVAVVVTDYTCHSLWFDPRADYYFVANDELKNLLLSLGARPDQVMVTGIPIRPPGITPRQADELPSNPPKILVMAGGLGMGPMEEIVAELLSLSESLDVTVVTGRNIELHQRLTAWRVPERHHLTTYGYTPEVPRLMAEADLLVTKPGGLSCSEALAAHLPMLLIHALPGQEEDNANFLAQADVAKVAHTPTEVAAVAHQLLFEQPETLRFMAQKAGENAKPHAARTIAQKLLDALPTHS